MSNELTYILHLGSVQFPTVSNFQQIYPEYCSDTLYCGMTNVRHTSSVTKTANYIFQIKLYHFNYSVQ